MARFPILEYDALTNDKAKLVYDQIKAELGFGMVPNLFKSMATNPEFLETQWGHFRKTILNGELPRTLKEMIGVAISQANNSQYALNVHLHGLSALGMSEEVLQTLVSDFEACPLPNRERPPFVLACWLGPSRWKYPRRIMKNCANRGWMRLRSSKSLRLPTCSRASINIPIQSRWKLMRYKHAL